MNVILFNAVLRPQYRTPRLLSALAITGHTIAAIGYDLSALRRHFPRHEVIDLGGRTVIPGLVDSHTHFYFWARTFNAIHLNGLTDFEEVLRRIKAGSRKFKKGEWIIGDGWAPDRWSTYHLPSAEELDRVTGESPAALFSKDQHMMWVNSAALRLAGIDRRTPEPKGGKVDRDPVSNDPTGILCEIPGYFPVIKLISRPPHEIVERTWKAVSEIAYSRGVTGFHSMDGPEAFDFFQYLHGRSRLGFRVHYYYPVKLLDELVERKVVSGTGDDTLRIGGIKIFADGSLGSQTAFLKRPYNGRKGYRGIETTPFAQLAKDIRKASTHGLACAVHAIGDQAVANVIDAFLQAGNNQTLRHRIEHLQLISQSDIPRLRRTGAIASMQPSHCPSDRTIVARYWGERGRNAFIFKTLMNNRIPLAFGSDCPIERLNPLEGIHAAVSRNGYGERGDRFYPEESLTVSRAVYGFTAGAAYAAGRESFSGKLAAGCQADLVILDDDIYSMPRSDIWKARVAATIYDGRTVYRSASLALL